jgi:hypothetical protein
MASPFEPRVPVAAEMKVVAMRAGEMVGELAGEMEAITVEMLEGEEETGAVVTTATAAVGMAVVEATVAVEEMAALDTATAVERIRAVVMVMEEGWARLMVIPPVTYLISRISNLL